VKIDLTGRTAVIVGGSGGLGEAMAHTLSQAGAAIALVGRNQAKLDKVAGDLKAKGGEFDVVFSRFVLTHLPDPLATLTHMVRRLRPGGLAIVEDIDFRGHFCHPDNWAFRRYVELYIETVRGRGADANIGPRLPSLLRAAGCDGVAVQVVQPAGLTGEVKLIAAITMENIADAVLAEQLATHAEIDRLVDELHAIAADDQTLISLPRIVQAWGRRDATDLR